MKLEWSESFKQDLPVDYILFLRDNPTGVLLKIAAGGINVHGT